MKVNVSDCAHRMTRILDQGRSRLDVPAADKHINRCVAAVRESLKSPSTHFRTVQQQHLGQIYHSMRWTHFSIRELLLSGNKNPKCVDAMPLVRLQLEKLFGVCLMVEDASALDDYLKNEWKLLYIRDLLMRGECQDLPEVMHVLDKQAASMEQLRALAGVSEEEKETIKSEALGIPLSPGLQRRSIRKFPTPAGVLDRLKNTNRKRMLCRLYLEYQFLCSDVHVSPHSVSFKALFDSQEPFGQMFSTAQLDDMFHNEIAGPAVWIDFLSIVQSCAEMIPIFSGDIELRRNVEEAWRYLSEQTYVGQAIWELRAKELLGIFG